MYEKDVLFPLTLKSKGLTSQTGMSTAPAACLLDSPSAHTADPSRQFCTHALSPHKYPHVQKTWIRQCCPRQISQKSENQQCRLLTSNSFSQLVQAPPVPTGIQQGITSTISNPCPEKSVSPDPPATCRLTPIPGFMRWVLAER